MSLDKLQPEVIKLKKLLKSCFNNNTILKNFNTNTWDFERILMVITYSGHICEYSKI